MSLFEVILVLTLQHAFQNNSEYGHFLRSVYHVLDSDAVDAHWFRYTCPEVLCKKMILKFLQNFRLGPGTLLKKRLRRRCFPVNFAKFLRTPFLIEQLRWLSLLIFILRLFLHAVLLRPIVRWENTIPYHPFWRVQSLVSKWYVRLTKGKTTLRMNKFF